MPVYEEKNKVDGQKRYFIKVYVNGKQLTRRNKTWVGRNGKFLAQQEENRLRGLGCDLTTNISFNELIDKYLDESKTINKESTYYTYFKLADKWVRPYLGFKRTNQICLNDFIAWREFIKNSNISVRMKNKCHNLVSSILNYGIKYGYIENNYEEKLGSFKEKKELVNKEEKIKYITYPEFKEFIKNVDNINWYTYFYFLYLTGVRKGESQALSWEDIDFENNCIYINKSLTPKTFEGAYKVTDTKTHENRKIDMDNKLKEILLNYYELKRNEDFFDIKDFVFGGKKPLSRTSIDRYKHYYFEKCSVNEITIHQFRHSHVSLIVNEAVKENLDMLSVFIMLSERMGHTIEVMQQTYLHLFPNIQNKVVDIMNNLEKQGQ